MNKRLFLIVLFLVALPLVNALSLSNTTLHYKFDNDSISGTLLKDTLGLRNATISGTPKLNLTGWIKDSVNWTSGKAQTQKEVPQNNITICSMINHNTATGTNGDNIFDLAQGTSEAFDFGFLTGQGTKPYFTFQSDGSNYGTKYVNEYLSNNTWYSLCFSRIGTNVHIYVNGVDKPLTNSTTGNPLGALNGNRNMTIGDRWSVTTYNFKGLIDELVVFNRILNDSEILEWNSSMASKITYPYTLTNNAFDFNGSSSPVNNSQTLSHEINFTQGAYLVNNTVNCSLFLNGVNNETKQYSNVTNQTYSFTIDFFKNITNNGIYNYSFSCKSLITNDTTNTTISYFNIIASLINISFVSPTEELNQTEFLFEVQNTDDVLNASAILNYSGILYTPTKDIHLSGLEEHFHFNYTLLIPLVNINGTNQTFFWIYNLSYHNGSFENNKASQLNGQIIYWHDFLAELRVILYNVQNFTTNITNGTEKYSNFTTNGVSDFFIPMNAHQNKSFSVFSYGLNPFNSMNGTYLVTYLTNNTFTLFGNTTLYINLTDEETNTLITQNVSLLLRGLTSEMTYTTVNGVFIIQNLTPDSYRLDFTSQNYSSRTFYVTIENSTFNYLNAWLIKSTSSTQIQFTTRDQFQNLVQGAQYSFLRLINGNYVSVAQKTSDVTGTIKVNLDNETIYKIQIVAPNFQTKQFNLEILDTQYTIFLSLNQTVQFQDFQKDVTYNINPDGSVLAPGDNTTFTLSTNSPSGYISYFGITSLFNGTTYLQNITGSPSGGQAIISLNLSGFDGDTITLNYFIQTQGGSISLNRSYYLYNLSSSATNSSFNGVMCTYQSQINPFFRFLIAIIISLLIGAGFFVLLGAMGSSAIAWLAFLAFGIGTCPFIPIIFPIVTGILIVLGYVVTGGNEGV